MIRAVELNAPERVVFIRNILSQHNHSKMSEHGLKSSPTHASQVKLTVRFAVCRSRRLSELLHSGESKEKSQSDSSCESLRSQQTANLTVNLTRASGVGLLKAWLQGFT